MSIIALSAGRSTSAAGWGARHAGLAAGGHRIAARSPPAARRPRASSACRRRHVRQRAIRGEPRVEVLAEPGPQGALRRGGQHVGPQVRGADRVGLLDDQVLPVDMNRDAAPAKLKATSRPEQAEHRAASTTPAPAPSWILRSPAGAVPAADLQAAQHRGEDTARQQHDLQREIHSHSGPP